MNYRFDEVPLVSKLYSYQNDKLNNRVICSSRREIKILNCDPELLEEVLLNVDGSNTFGEIEKKFVDRYLVEEVKFFLEAILKEGIIEKSQTSYETKKMPLILVIGEGLIAEEFNGCNNVSVRHFLDRDFICDFDLAIVAPSISTYSDILTVNGKIYKLKKPFTQISFNGVEVTAGPLVVPDKSACLECGISFRLKSVNAKLSNDEKITVNDLKNINYSYNISEGFGAPKISYIANTLHNDLINYFNGLPSEFLDFQYYFNNSYFLSSNKENKLPTTYCNFCNAINKNYVKADSNFNLKESLDMSSSKLSENSVKYQVGGIRSKTENETKELLEAELRKLGAKIKVERSIENPFNSAIPSYDAYLEQMNCTQTPYCLRKDESSGKGITDSQAYFSATFELFEHIGRQYTGDVPIISAKYSDVKNFAIDMPHLANTVMNKNTAYDDFDENTEIDWVIATSLTGAEKKLVPAFLVFMYDVELKGTLFAPSSTGVAAGATLCDAILHGLFEAIEHDAWDIGQSNSYILPLVDYESITNTKIKEAVSKIKLMGYDIITRDYTNDLKIPVFRTWIVNRKDYSNYAYMGFGCHISPEIALERSITEATQTNNITDFSGYIDSSMINQKALSKSLVNLYNQHFLINKDIFGKTDKVTKIGEPIFELNSAHEIIEKVSKWVKEKVEGDVFYVSLTKPDMNIEVVRVLITGDIQRANYPILSASKRMFEFGIRCGYSDKKSTYEELFMGAHQH